MIYNNIINIINMNNITAIDVNTFKQIISEKQGCLLIKFGAEWCGPCKKIAPYIENKISEIKNKKLQYINIDIDENCDIYIFLKRKKLVTKLPTFLLYKASNKSINDEDFYIPDYSVIGIDENALDIMFKMIE